MRYIGIIGATGSIGTQTIDVILKNPSHFSVTFLTTHGNMDLIQQQVELVQPAYVVITGDHHSQVEIGGAKVLYGMDALIDLIRNEPLDLVLSSAVGFAGIRPTMECAERGIDVALANKESIVSGGLPLLKTAERNGAAIIPVDSEHSAIYQCLMGHSKKDVSKIILTASGGSFRNRPMDSFEHISISETLNHPNWSMGHKITVDSATMMNKGLELIEARYLFDVTPDKLDVVIHPQSIIHSMVSYSDGSMIAQMGLPDMRVPISFALGYPERINSGADFFDLSVPHTLTFEPPNLDKYPCLKIAIDVLNEDQNSLMVVMNAANEVAVEMFLKGRLDFLKIADVVEKALNFFEPANIFDMNQIIELDERSRQKVRELIESA